MARNSKKAADQPAGAKAPAGNDNAAPAAAPARGPIPLFKLVDDKKLERTIFLSRDMKQLSMEWKGGKVASFDLAEARQIASDFIEGGQLHGKGKRTVDYAALSKVMIALLAESLIRETSQKELRQAHAGLASLTRDLAIARDQQGPRKRTKIFN